jgi:hypothetical protein
MNTRTEPQTGLKTKKKYSRSNVARAIIFTSEIGADDFGGASCDCSNHYWIVHSNQIDKINSKGKTVAPKPSKFALQYELNKDPTEYFAILPEVKARLKELAENSSLKRDSIFLHTIAKTQKVELGTSITIRKHAGSVKN